MIAPSISSRWTRSTYQNVSKKTYEKKKKINLASTHAVWLKGCIFYVCSHQAVPCSDGNLPETNRSNLEQGLAQEAKVA